MTISRPFHSSHSIGGVECDFPSKEELLEYLGRVVSPPARGGAGGGGSFVHIVTLNAEMVVEAQHNEEFKTSINNAEVVIPDGSSMLWAREYLDSCHPGPNCHSGLDPESTSSARRRMDPGSEAGMTRPNIVFSLVQFFFSHQKPITGVDTIFDICEIMEKKKGTVYLLGGKQHEAQKTAEILRKKYPELLVSLPLFKGELEGVSLDRNMHPTQPPLEKGRGHDAIFVALGSPKQSLWIESNREILTQADINIAMGVGGAFNMISGILPRAPKWMRQHHLEWLWRLILEPRRIKRIWNAVVVFPRLIYKATR